MKCPKCGYLGFERIERCRNCGYDFSLAQSPGLPELRIRSAESDQVGPVELPLTDPASLLPARPASEHGPEFSRAMRSQSSRPVVTPELPLFGAATTGEPPLVTKPLPPRPPLAVRRATPEVPRVRAEPLRPAMLDLVSPDPAPAQRLAPRGGRTEQTHVETGPASAESAGVIARAAAGVIDLLMLAAIDGAVLYFTIQVCGLRLDELEILPKGPLIAFFLVQNGGYLVAFNAGGQTLGKMAVGIKVIAARTGTTLDLGRSLLRTFVWGLLAVPGGLGFLSALFSRDRRGLHDLCAGTRVVRVGAT